MIKFEHPYVNVIKFQAADVVTTSGDDGCADFSCADDAGEW